MVLANGVAGKTRGWANSGDYFGEYDPDAIEF